jgi:nucleoside-diphosphate-sugar epimerase
VVWAILRLMGRGDLQPIILNNQKNEIPWQHVVDCPEWWQPQTSLEEGLRKTIAWYSSRV